MAQQPKRGLATRAVCRVCVHRKQEVFFFPGLARREGEIAENNLSLMKYIYKKDIFIVRNSRGIPPAADPEYGRTYSDL